MKKKLLLVGLAVMLIFQCGCSSLLKKEYLSIAQYTVGEHNEAAGNAREVSTYAELKNEINDMVKNHVDEERLRFTNYDGAIHNDLSQVFREVEEETALGSFSVDYMSYYEIGRFITYYEATVYINFSRTQEEIAAITYITGETRLIAFLEETMSALGKYVAIRINSTDLTESGIIAAVNKVFGANPASCVLNPQLTVKIHPSAGYERIVEIEFDYGRPTAIISGMKLELVNVIEETVSGIVYQDVKGFAVEAYNALAGMVTYDPDGEIRSAKALVPSLSGSIYGALVEGVSDSRGFALAYSAMCREAGIPCLVVTGTLDKEEHSWNIIELDESFYHVDVSSDGSLGITGAFGRSDDQMLSNYWWNIEDYPECSSFLDAADIFASAY